MTLETAIKGAFDSFIATKTAAQVTVFRKAFALWAGLELDQYTQVNTTNAADRMAAVIKAKAKAVNEAETVVSYTDLDTDA